MKQLIYFVFFLLFLDACYQTNEEITSGTVEVDGVDLYYEVTGRGEPLVLIHGNGGDRRHWDDQITIG